MGCALVDVTMVDSVHQCGKSESGRKGEEGRTVWTRGVDHQELWHLLVLRAFVLPFFAFKSPFPWTLSSFESEESNQRMGLVGLKLLERSR